MIISHNMLAMNANRQYGINTTSKSKTMEKLSSGYRIKGAADDAAGLAISSKMRKQIRGLEQGVRNSQDGISLCQVAEGALAETTEMLQRINQLAVQAANGTNSKTDRQAIQHEIEQIKQEINHIGETTKFNEEKVFDSKTPDTMISRNTYKLVNSPSAEDGFMIEAMKIGSSYYSCAKLDFSIIDEENIKSLNGQKFEFTCSMSCSEKFIFRFVDRNGGENKFVDKNNIHDYTIDVGDIETGEELLAKLYKFVKDNLPPKYPFKEGDTELQVCHSNYMSLLGKNTLVIRSYRPHAKEESALNFYKNENRRKENYGKVICNLYASPKEYIPEDNIYYIQAGGEKNDKIEINIQHMNTKVLGIEDIKVLSDKNIEKALARCEEAIIRVSKSRARLGAQQNRLEHTIRNELNTVENLTASESRIRDADMASEMVKLSNSNILTQAGEAMLVQANQLNQGVLSLLQ